MSEPGPRIYPGRRSVVTGAMAALMGTAAPSDAAIPLKTRAAAKGVLYGSAVSARALAADPAYAALIARECAIMVPAIEAKWLETERHDGEFTLGPLDEIAAFARAHGAKLRLHNLVWGVFNPPWLEWALLQGRGAEVLRRHIAAVAGRYRGQALAWDVLNEPSDPRWNQDDGLVAIPWKKALGPTYLDQAFADARAADPAALLFVNDDLLEYDDAASAQKRATYLRVLEAALARDVPIEGFGLECHLRPDRKFSPRVYRQFLRDLAAMGLVLHITELDVCDRTLSADPSRRGAEVAAYTKGVLDAALDEKALRAVLTWGITTRYSWLGTDPAMRREDGRPSLGLPYDARLAATPMLAAMAAAFESAPKR